MGADLLKVEWGWEGGWDKGDGEEGRGVGRAGHGCSSWALRPRCPWSNDTCNEGWQRSCRVLATEQMDEGDVALSMDLAVHWEQSDETQTVSV